MPTDPHRLPNPINDINTCIKDGTRRGKYFRLSLNNPVQATSAHQTKRAASLLFEHIVENGHFGKVKICNILKHFKFKNILKYFKMP